MLGLKTNEQVSRSAKTGLKAQCHGRAHPFALPDDIAELGGADVHGPRGLNLGNAVMFQCIADDGGSGIRKGLWDLGGIPQNGAWLGFHLGLIQ